MPLSGGSMEESVYIDGVVFRKNVAHKKMGGDGSKRYHPRILLIAEGIEFQRSGGISNNNNNSNSSVGVGGIDMKLSSLDTLIEQEDKHMEIAVQKIMSLKPG